MSSGASVKKPLWRALVKWSLFFVLMYFVGARAVSLWQSSPKAEIHVDGRWLIPAALFYLLGWTPSVWFWHSLMRRMGQRVGWYATIRAYFLGHLGKYVPGKAMVLVIRGALIKQVGGNGMLAALTAVYETLIFMYAAAALAVALAPLSIPAGTWDRAPESLRWMREQPFLLPAVVLIATVGSSPFSAAIFTQIGRKTLPADADSLPSYRISAGHVLQGVFSTSAGWMCNACSLGCTLQAISESPQSFQEFPIWLVATTASTFAGFVVLVAPGGLGVREGILVELLKDQPQIGAERALIAAGLLRLVWFLTELCVAAILYAIKPNLTK